MRKELEIYKQFKINELKRNFSYNANQLYMSTLHNIRIASSSRARNKQAMINSLIAKYNRDMFQLRNKVNVDINKVNSYNPVFNVSAVNKKALLIGINYPNTPYPLTGCVDDVTRMRECLSKFGFGKFTTMTDAGEVKPTKEAILREFKQMISTASAGDLLFFYFSGHGSFTYDVGGDEEDTNDEMIISSDLKGVLDDEFKQILLTDMKEGVTVIGFFDSCHSGTMFDLKFNYTDSNNYRNTSDNEKASECKGNVIMISGCMDQQTSSEATINGKVEGAVTCAFIEAMKENKQQSWRELLQSMRDFLKSNGFDQLPQLSTDTFYDISSTCFL
jgi:hypothetical protein